MLGGLAFLRDGNMLVGISGDELMVRLDPQEAEAALDEPHTRPFDVTGRPMRGWLLVGADGLDSDRQLGAWVDRASAYVATLPAKT
jgi:TfoX N-terminal domain